MTTLMQEAVHKQSAISSRVETVGRGHPQVLRRRPQARAVRAGAGDAEGGQLMDPVGLSKNRP
jgi:hypothetical protein